MDSISDFMEQIKQEKGLQTHEIFYLLQKSIEETIQRKVNITFDDDVLKIYRINTNGSMTELNIKALERAKKAFRKKMDEAINSRYKINRVVEKNTIYLAQVLDMTANGFFLVVKQIKVFLPLNNISAEEISEGKISLGSKILVEIIKIGQKIIATRKSVKILKKLIFDTFQREFKIKSVRDKFILFCSKPYLNDIDIKLIRQLSPMPIYFKKIKEVKNA